MKLFTTKCSAGGLPAKTGVGNNRRLGCRRAAGATFEARPWPAVALAVAFITACLAAAPARTSPLDLEIAPTVFMVEREGRLDQVLRLTFGPGTAGVFTVAADSQGRRLETRIELTPDAASADVLVPACEKDPCPTAIAILDEAGTELFKTSFNLPYQRRWKIFLSPFSHVDVGFTNSQRKILAQNLDNLRAALDLIDATRADPPDARFKFFTEVSWPTHEFLYSDATSADEKQRLIAALQKGQVELGAFIISHENKFMPAEALFRSADWALQISRDFGVPLKTGCLNDLADLSAAVKPLAAAGVPYFVAGPNTSHYVAPPLFYLQPPIGDEKLLVWLTPNLNGYGENFDLAMRPDLPISDAALAEIQRRLGPYLKSLETDGAPPMSVRAHSDFYGQTWPYPYDLYFLPFYPAHAVDNGPQDETPAELARLWGQRWAYPKLIVANPTEFFAAAESAYAKNIPVLRGDLPGFWGEQIFFAMLQVDPAKEAAQRHFERAAVKFEIAAALDPLHFQPPRELFAEIAHGFKLISLNNDHNPGPVPFGHTNYTKDDVEEWKRTRREWIEQTLATVERIKPWLLKWSSQEPTPALPSPGFANVSDEGGRLVMENDFYQVEIEKETGGISSIIDKELGQELVSADGPYLLNQYVAVARGENAGWRGTLFHRAGFSRVKVEVVPAGPLAVVRVTGAVRRNRDQVKVLTEFVERALGVRVPAFLIRALTPVLGARLGRPDQVEQTIVLEPGDKTIYFKQRLTVDHDQAIDHTFAYPLNVPLDRPLTVEGPYNPYRFAPAPPFGDGDLIPAAKITDVNFPGINDLTQVFQWIQGLPADAVFRTYVLAQGDGFGVAFSSQESGAIIPGPLDQDPLDGPFGGGFYHVALGWTAFGKAFLGAPREGDFIFHSALTSFPIASDADARARAANFGHLRAGVYRPELVFNSSAPAVLLVAARPLDGHAVMLRLYESSGAGADATITLPRLGPIARATRARSDGQPFPGGGLETHGGAFAIRLSPGEVVTVRLELESH